MFPSLSARVSHIITSDLVLFIKELYINLQSVYIYILRLIVG